MVSFTTQLSFQSYPSTLSPLVLDDILSYFLLNCADLSVELAATLIHKERKE